MGIETILIVFGVIAIVAIVVAARKSKRKIENHVHNPDSEPRL